MTLVSLREKLLANPVPIQLPLGAEENFVGFIDLLEMQALIFQKEDVGATFVVKDIPREYIKTAEKARKYTAFFVIFFR